MNELKTKIFKKFTVSRYYKDEETWELKRYYDDQEVFVTVGGCCYNIEGVKRLIKGLQSILKIMIKETK